MAGSLLRRILDLVELLANYPRGLPLQSIADTLAIPKSVPIPGASDALTAFGVVAPGNLQSGLLLAGGFVMTAASGSVPSVAIDVIHPGLRATAAAMVPRLVEPVSPYTSDIP